MWTKIAIWLLIWFHKNMFGYAKVSTKLIYAQTWHETGNFKSEVYKANKNLFGMRMPSVRETYANGSNLNHATYKNHNDSIRDYFKRQKYFDIPNSDDSEYIDNTVNSNYAEDNLYKEKWQTVTKQIKMPVNNIWVLGGLFFLVLITSIIIYKKSKS